MRPANLWLVCFSRGVDEPDMGYSVGDILVMDTIGWMTVVRGWMDFI